MKYLLVFTFLYLTDLCAAQSHADTLFFNANWKRCQRSKASFYRVWEAQPEGGFILHDRYIENNKPQMDGFSMSIEPTYMMGKCTYYYKNGNKEAEGWYRSDRKSGVWVNWSEDGKDSTIQHYAIGGKVTFVPGPVSSAQKYVDSINLQESRREAALDFVEEKPGFVFSLRGKFSTMFIIEDIYFLTYTLGTEFAYNNHSIGVDYTWFRWRYQEDDSKDIEMYDRLELRTYLHIDYKYTLIRFPEKQFDIYFNAYDKIGDYREWYDPYEYDHGNADMTFLLSKKQGTFNEPGLGLGFRFGKPFGMDMSLNAAYRMSVNDEWIYENKNTMQFNDNRQFEQFLGYVRLNLYYQFGQ